VARRALTAAAVERLKPPASGQAEHFDAGYPGLGLRISYAGRRAWVYVYRAAGKPRRLTLGAYPAMSLAEAREAWREARAAVEIGGDPAAAKAEAREARASGRDAVRTLFDDYRRRKLSKLKAGDQPARMLERLMLPAWGDRRAQEITRRDVLDLIEGVAERTPPTANRLKAYGGAFFAWLVARDVLDRNPFAGIKPPAKEVSRDRVLSDDEIRWLWRGSEAVGYPFGPLARFLLVTGQRLREGAGLRWDELDGDLWRLPGARVKNGRAHAVPLSAAALAELGALPRIAGASGPVYAFTTTGDTPVSGFNRGISRLRAAMAKEAAKDRGEPVTIADWSFHDLRRTAATGFARLGVPLQTAEAILNHVSGSRAGVAGVYNRHDYAREAREAMDRWAAHLAGLTADRPANVVQIGAAR